MITTIRLDFTKVIEGGYERAKWVLAQEAYEALEAADLVTPGRVMVFIMNCKGMTDKKNISLPQSTSSTFRKIRKTFNETFQLAIARELTSVETKTQNTSIDAAATLPAIPNRRLNDKNKEYYTDKQEFTADINRNSEDNSVAIVTFKPVVT